MTLLTVEELDDLRAMQDALSKAGHESSAPTIHRRAALLLKLLDWYDAVMVPKKGGAS